MRSPNRILVPTDFTAPSNAAVEYARTLGEHFGADVDILHVWHPPEEVSSTTELLTEFAKSDPGHKMKDALESFEGRSSVQARGCLTPGDPEDIPDAIVRLAEGEYDLVVMGAHEHRGVYGLSQGTVEKVMLRSPCPVVAIHVSDFGAATG